METQSHIYPTSASRKKGVLGNAFSQIRNTFKKSKAFRNPDMTTQKKTRVFIVDDDPMYLKILEHSMLSNIDSVAINTFQTGEACLQNLKLKPSIVILDYHLNSEFPYAWNGITILKHIRRISPRTKIIMVSSQDSLSVAIDCMEKGAHDYVSKSRVSLLRINNIVKNIVGDIEVNSAFYRTVQFIILVVILILIASFIIRY